MALPKQRTTETMSVSEARQRFSETLNRVYQGDERVIIEKNGIPVAAIVPISTVRDAEITEQNRDEALNAFRRVQEAFADIPGDELERELAEALAEAKAIQRAKRASRESMETE
jgi:prevent-host-death family protein